MNRCKYCQQNIQWIRRHRGDRNFRDAVNQDGTAHLCEEWLLAKQKLQKLRAAQAKKAAECKRAEQPVIDQFHRAIKAFQRGLVRENKSR